MSLLENSLENIFKNNSIDSSQLISRLVKVETYFNSEGNVCWKYTDNDIEYNIDIHTKIFLKICDTLIKNEALLAGGSVLGSFSEFQNKNLDLDIYVNEKNSNKIYQDLSNIGYNKVTNVCLAPPYDQSFFKKNHITSRFRLINKNFIPIDLMIIPDNISLVSVVTNFDLSFCEIWFDGQNVYAVDPEGIKNKEGKLKPDYNESLFKYFNNFIIKRIEKYGKRGFKISYSSPFSTCNFLAKKEEIKDITIPNGTIQLYNELTNSYVYPEEWAIKIVLNKFYKINCQNNFNIYHNFTLTEFTWQNLFSMLKRYYHVTPLSYGIYSFTNSDLQSIPMPSEYRWVNPANPRFPEDASPEFKQKRVDFKIKLLIKYLILNDLKKGQRGWGNEKKILKWKEYLNKVLNSDIENDEGRVINGENFYVNFLNNTNEDLTSNQSKLLTDILYIENILDPLSFTHIIDGEIEEDRKPIELSTFKIIIDFYFLTINQRGSISYYKNNYLIPNDFQILNIELFVETDMNEWLDEDPTNLIFLYNSVQSDAVNGIKGIGLTKNALYQLYAKLIVECKKSNIGLGVYQDDVIINKIYNVLTVGDSLNNGILLSKLNCVKDELDKVSGNRIFYLTEERLLKSIAGLSSVSYYNRISLNIHGSYRNLVSAVHCGEGQETRVYDEIFIIDKNKLVSRSEFDRVLATGIIENNVVDTQSSAYMEISDKISEFIYRPSISSFKLLMNSIRDGDIDIATEIIGGNDTNFLNKQDEDGNTPLIFAIDLGEKYIALAKLLLKNKVDVNIQNNLGETALMIACEAFEYKIIKLLIKNGADVTIVNKIGNTSLIALAYKFNSLTSESISKNTDNIEKSFKKLLNASEEVINLQNNKGETFLIVISKNLILENIRPTMIEDILKYKMNINIQDNDGYTALMYLVKNGNFSGVEQLLKNGTDLNINLVNKYGDTALNLALFYTFTGIIKLLLDKPDINLNIKNNEGYTSLMCAIEEYTNLGINTIKYIVDRGADINIQDNNGDTPLMFALQKNYVYCAKYLIDKNADISITNNEGYTALHYAIYTRNISIIKFLLRKGADMNLKNNEGFTPLDIATEQNIDLNTISSNLEEEKEDTYLEEEKEEDMGEYYDGKDIIERLSPKRKS